MDDFSANECRELAAIIRQIIILMQKVDQRTVLPVSKPATGAATSRKLSRRVGGAKAKVSKTMVCPAPMASSTKKQTRRMSKPKMTGSTAGGTKTMGYTDASGQCVCPMPSKSNAMPTNEPMLCSTSRTAPPPGFKPGYTGPITRSMSAAMCKRNVTRRPVEVDKTEKKGMKVKQRKQKVRRQNRKRPVMKKSPARGGC